MNTQQAYENVRAYFTRPGAELATVAVEEGALECVYRGDDDPASPLRCAAGSIIPDEEYRPEFEGKSALSIWQAVPTFRDSEIDRHFLTAAQEAHDGSSYVAQFVGLLDNLAAEFGLEVIS